MLNLLFTAQHRKSTTFFLAIVSLLLASWPIQTTSAQAEPLATANLSGVPTNRQTYGTSVTSPYAYPTPDDSTFVSSQSSQLGQYVSSGYIDFYIPINRVFTTKTVDHAVAKGILPAISELTISFYANEPRFCWPLHRVTLNGHDLAWVMPRAEGHWLLTTIPFPTTYLEKLPKLVANAAPQPEWQKVRIYVDTAQCQCGLQVQWGSIKINAARPVMLVHGWSGNRNSWVEFSKLLEDDGMPFERADLANGIKSIPTSGAILAGQVHNALIEFGVSKINLIAHSKGGLFTRWALDNDLAPVVERLITLASPHHGIDDARLLIAKANNCPNFGSSDPYAQDDCQVSADETSMTRMREDMNYTDCKYSATLGGLPTYTECVLKANPQPDIAYFSVVGTDDVFVENASSTYPWRADSSPYPLNTNVDVALPGRGHFTVKGGRTELNCAMSFINPRAYSSADCGGQIMTSATQTENAQPAGHAVQTNQQLIWVTHTVTSNELTLPLNLVKNERASILINAGQAVSTSLTMPDGQQIPSTSAATDELTYQEVRGAFANESDWSAEYQLAAPITGTWQVNVAMPAAITMPVPVAIAAWVSSTTQLQVQFDKPIYQSGDIVHLTAILADNGSSAANPLPVISGQLWQTDTTPLLLHFVDDGTGGDPQAGDGHYTASFVAPTPLNTPYFSIEVGATQGNLRRQVITQLPINPNSGRIDPSVPITVTQAKRNPDQLYERLTLSPTIYVSRTGHFRLTGNLVDTAGKAIATASTASRIAGEPWGIGSRAVMLKFDGTQIRRQAMNGPYHLVDLRLYDENASAILIDTLPEAANFVTPAYDYHAFAGDDPVITAVTQQAIDTDGNGRYNQLRITATLSGTTAGNYLWSGWLVDAQGGHIAQATGQGDLAHDQATIQFAFAAPAIRQNAQNGPYHLAEIVLQPSSAAGYYHRLIWLTTDFTTPAYRYSQFDDELPMNVTDTPDLSTRQAAVDFYRQEYRPDTPSLGWTGNLTDCLPGEVSPAYQAALLQRVNYFRRMAGLPSAVLSSTLSAKAQAAALYMARNKSVSHGLDASLPCYTVDAHEAATRSNLHAAFNPTASLTAIDGYIRDTGLETLGHRRWLLLPQLEQIGGGDVASNETNFRVNVLYLITSHNLNAARPAPRDGFVAWPPPGYVPYQVVHPYWSFSIAGADLVSASVRMLKDGVPISVTVAPVTMRYGDNTLAWVPLGLDANDRAARWPQPESGHEAVYTVIIDHAGVNNVYRRFTYTVTVIDPNAPAPVVPRMWLPVAIKGKDALFE